MNYLKLSLAALLGLVILYIAVSLVRRSRLSTSQINLEDLLLGEDGKISKVAAVMMGAYAMTTWLMIYLALNSKMTEGYLAIYVGAWIAPTVTKMIVNAPVVPAKTESSTIVTSATSTGPAI